MNKYIAGVALLRGRFCKIVAAAAAVADQFLAASVCSAVTVCSRVASHHRRRGWSKSHRITLCVFSDHQQLYAGTVDKQ